MLTAELRPPEGAPPADVLTRLADQRCALCGARLDPLPATRVLCTPCREAA